jgi:hypothetical protein
MTNMTKLLFLTFIIVCNAAFAQTIKGILLNSENRQPIEFANIGIVGKNAGTVTDINGRFNFQVDPKFDNDSIQFSIIGYKARFIKIADLRKQNENLVLLDEKNYDLTEVIIKPKTFRPRTLGITTKFKGFSLGPEDNNSGQEWGVLMKVKKTAFIKTVIINIAHCSYDTIFYRLNIYKVIGELDFENILKEPIYIEITKEAVRDQIQVDLQSKNIVVDGDFLITLEHVKDLGKGSLYFCAGLMDKTYFRNTSQGNWETVPVGISISVFADVEK